jgi:hypothetical protein
MPLKRRFSSSLCLDDSLVELAVPQTASPEVADRVPSGERRLPVGEQHRTRFTKHGLKRAGGEITGSIL